MKISASSRSTLSLVVLVVAAAGCGGYEPMVSMDGDPKALSQLMDEWNDAKGSPQQAAKLFASGQAPAAARLKKYYSYSYTLTSVPRANGDSATLPVEIFNEKSGGDPVRVDWTFKKEDGAWKIASAPLP